jgi:hypothetical protein
MCAKVEYLGRTSNVLTACQFGKRVLESSVALYFPYDSDETP